MTSTSVQPTSASGPDATPFRTVDPYTGRSIREYPYLVGEQLDEIVERAAAAFELWRDEPVERRAHVLARAAELVRERKDDLAASVTREMGKLITEARAEVDLAAAIFDYYAEHGPEFLRPRELDVDEGTAELVNEPIGVLLGIEPWNFPLYQVARFAAPNVLLGNVILLKTLEFVCADGTRTREALGRRRGAGGRVQQPLPAGLRRGTGGLQPGGSGHTSLTGSERAPAPPWPRFRAGT